MIRVVVSLDAIELPQGCLIKASANWQDYQILLGHLGDRVSPRVRYRRRELLFDRYPRKRLD